MPGLLTLFFDTVNKALVVNRTSSTPYVIPDLHQEDAITIDFVALRRIAIIGTQFEVINLAGYSLTISLGSANSPIAQALPGAFTIDAANQMFSGTLDINTAGINALADGGQTTLEILLTNGTNRYRGQFLVTIRKSVAMSASVNPVVLDTALGRLEAKRTFVLKEGAPGEGQIYTSEDGTKKGFVYWHNDGSFRGEPLT